MDYLVRIDETPQTRLADNLSPALIPNNGGGPTMRTSDGDWFCHVSHSRFDSFVVERGKSKT